MDILRQLPVRLADVDAWMHGNDQRPVSVNNSCCACCHCSLMCLHLLSSQYCLHHAAAHAPRAVQAVSRLLLHLSQNILEPAVSQVMDPPSALYGAGASQSCWCKSCTPPDSVNTGNVPLRLSPGLKVLRFAQWQRVWGDTNNAAMRPRTLQERSTPSSHSYLRKDGVSVEHMVALANKVRRGMRGGW